MTFRRLPGQGMNAIEYWLLIGAILQGGTFLLGLSTPRTLETALGHHLSYIWAGFLVVGGLLALLGYSSIGLYKVGLALCATGAGTYGVALALNGATGLVAAVLNLSFAVACALRIRQISRQLDKLRNQLVTEDRPRTEE